MASPHIDQTNALCEANRRERLHIFCKAESKGVLFRTPEKARRLIGCFLTLLRQSLQTVCLVNRESQWSRSAIVKYAAISTKNLAALLVGIFLGITFAPHLEHKVSAAPPQLPTVSTQSPAPACVPSSTVECVTPIMIISSAGIGTLLTNRIASDQVIVNGYDVLKLENNILNAMVKHKVITPQEAGDIASQSHPDKTLRFQPPQPQPSPAQPQK